MASVTTWTRLEPLPRTADLAPALEARVADPLWLLARQWQVGEFQGEDAGSPIVARLAAESARLGRYHPGLPGDDAESRAVGYDDTGPPLEVLVEREPVRGAAGPERLRAETGMHFLRMLGVHRAKPRRRAYLDVYAMTFPTDEPVDHATATWRALVEGRVPDGGKLYDDLAAHRGAADELTSLPAEPAIPPGDVPKVLAAANGWLAWYEALLAEPDGDSAWRDERLEYSFALSAATTDGPVVLTAEEYSAGRLDWHAFDAADAPDLGAADPARPPETIVRTVVPTQVHYRGKPADRFWQFEDGEVSFGAAPAGPSDLARLLLVEFALVYGNDWFVIPIDLPVGSVCRVASLEVTDTFGVTTQVGPSRDSTGWSMFELSAPAQPARLRNVFLLPPALVGVLEGAPVEQVALFRDETANMVWGVERIVESPTGEPLDRYEEYQRSGGAGERGRIDGEIGDAELIYRLMTTVPENWIPFVPVPTPGAAPGRFDTRLERRAMLRISAGGSTERIEPRGRILLPGRPLQVEEEEVPRAGAVVERSYQYTRGTDGTGYLWVGRRKRSGRGEGSSGLRFDVAEPPGA